MALSQQVIWRAISIPDHGFEPTGYLAGDIHFGSWLRANWLCGGRSLRQRGFEPAGYVTGNHHPGSWLYALHIILHVAHDGTHGFMSHRLCGG
jgi:hypothetical protein